MHLQTVTLTEKIIITSDSRHGTTPLTLCLGDIIQQYKAIAITLLNEVIIKPY